MGWLKIVCKFLKEHKSNEFGYYCSSHIVCENLNNMTYECPIIGCARDYESGKTRSIKLKEADEEKKEKKKPKAIL
jgi:hypothetical protein